MPLALAHDAIGAAAIELRCGRAIDLVQEHVVTPRAAGPRRHAWGTLLRAASVTPKPELVRWVRHMLGTDDHVRARSSIHRGTAPGGLSLIVEAGGAGTPLDGCTLSAPDLVFVPSDAGAGARVSANETIPFVDVVLDGACGEGGWREEEAVVIARGSGESVNGSADGDPRDGAALLQRGGSGVGDPAAAPGGGDASADAAWSPMSLVELRANARARFLPLLDIIFKGVMHEGMNKVGTPIVTQASAVVAGETGTEVSNEALPDQVDGDLGAMLAVRLKSEVTNVASDALTKRLASTLSAALTRTVGSHLLATLPTDDDGGVDVIVGEAAARVEASLPLAASSELTPRLYNALLPALLKSVALATAHAAVPALAAGLQPLRGRPAPMPQDGTSERRMHCDACLRAYLDAQHKYGAGEAKEQAEVSPETLRHCRLCSSPLGVESDKFAYHGMHLTHWYGEYYAEYWRQAAQEYLTKRAPQTEGRLPEARRARLFTAMRGAELKDK